MHLIYTLNQAYMAMEAGASFICPLAGRMQDQGHDAIQLFEQCVDVIDRYGYDSKVMFSSVRHRGARAPGDADRRARLHDAVLAS